MKVLVSACLLGENCKYNGGNNRHEGILKCTEGHEVISVCPEVLGGLPVPRIPCEIKDGIVINKEGEIKDKEFRDGAAKAFEIAKAADIDCAILQARSPNCGCREIYDGTFSKTKIKGHGIFAGLLIDAGYTVFDSEEIDENTDLNALILNSKEQRNKFEIRSEESIC